MLILSSDPIRPELAGTGIRAAEMARVLSQHCQVTLAAYDQADYAIEGVQMLAFSYDEPELIERLVASADVVILQGFLVTSFPFLTTINKIVIVDMYDPFPLGNLEFFRVRSPQDARSQHGIDMLVLRYLLGLGDFFLCASEAQRSYWLGALTATGRLSPAAYADDRTLRRLIDLAPFGLSSEPPQHTRQRLKGVHPGIGADDTLLLWGGGIWEWFDPLTLLRAMEMVGRERPGYQAVLPRPRAPEHARCARDADVRSHRGAGGRAGLRDRTVFFNDAWVPYAERAGLSAGGGYRRQHALREHRDAVRLPHAPARLPLGRPADDRQQRRHAVGAGGRAWRWATLSRRAIWPALAAAILKLVDEPDRRDSRAAAMAASA